MTVYYCFVASTTRLARRPQRALLPTAPSPLPLTSQELRALCASLGHKMSEEETLTILDQVSLTIPPEFSPSRPGRQLGSSPAPLPLLVLAARRRRLRGDLLRGVLGLVGQRPARLALPDSVFRARVAARRQFRDRRIQAAQHRRHGRRQSRLKEGHMETSACRARFKRLTFSFCTQVSTRETRPQARTAQAVR